MASDQKPRVPTFEWGVDRGALMSRHSEEWEARLVYDRCRANGLRVRLLRRETVPWEEVDSSHE